MTTLTRDDATHTYLLDGVVVPSVTQILAPLRDFFGILPDVLARKALIGTATHYACELDSTGELDEDSIHPSIAGYLQGFRKWRAESGAVIVENESFVHHPTPRYAGQLDLIVQFGSQPRRWLVDIKTAAEHAETWRLQTAGYAACRPDRDALLRASLQLKPDGRYQWRPYDLPEHAGDFAIWTALAMVHNWRKANIKGSL